ncbi:hypothetical protein TPHA_0A00550 [Tetrapisispora phaffii CBS 4417]|uniref:Uncharacterized protein n=1 Tax=Tetrapisispora phaffii (strain ATCC 24235 / CBS 4417 / NBRC 1672 / NRRL Y-8282 / UCD 70-5) TaxID=1071381 RepID=G8BML2_TETPH|nr:hypothetical protein TPHA_0A00550 [Tetrapisispora phaffii CBS 4417]CCE61140.1 hypothetical protein TPHA_0A00550 [Tetrapisispora phaffii CBS 4417]
MITGETATFEASKKLLLSNLGLLSNESKRRDNEIHQASDKSIEILKTVKSIDELRRHPDFILPFIIATSSGNAKLTSIALQCIQRFLTVEYIPKSQLGALLDSFISATHLADEIKLKVFQVLPTFFKTYSRYIYGPLCEKLLQCCSSSLLLGSKTAVIIDTANATMQQLIDEIFERLDYEWNSNDKETQSVLNEVIYDVIVADGENQDNKQTIKVNAYQYDVNRIFSYLCVSVDSSKTSSKRNETDHKGALKLDIMPLDYTLEIIESVLKNNRSAFIRNEDLRYLLRIKIIPSLLRIMSSSSQFTTVVRSYRSIRTLIKKEFLSVLEIELEVILSLIIYILSEESSKPLWNKVLSLELFLGVLKDTPLLADIYMLYDNYSDKKHIITNLLHEVMELINKANITNILQISEIIGFSDIASTLTETSMARKQYISILDKINPPPVDDSYIIWLIISIVCSYSDSLNVEAQSALDKGDTDSNSKIFRGIRTTTQGTFSEMFDLFVKLFHSNALDKQIFHSLLRSFQKLTHTVGILSMTTEVNKCLEVFLTSIYQNSVDDADTERTTDSGNIGQSSMSVLDQISDTLIGQGNNDDSNTENKSNMKGRLHSRNFNAKHIRLFRALISLSISLGSNLEEKSWKYILVSCQWVSYYLYGPSPDYKSSNFAAKIPKAPVISKEEINSIENSMENLIASTQNYDSESFMNFITTLMNCSSENISTKEEANDISESEFTNDSIKYCVYNRSYFMTNIGEISIRNNVRFSFEEGKESWEKIMNYYVYVIGNRDIYDVSLRFYATRLILDIIKSTIDVTDEMKSGDDKQMRFAYLQNLVFNPLNDSINVLKKLKIENQEIYNGVADIELKIALHILSALKDILNEIGDYMTDSWIIIFNIINCPFQWINLDGMNSLEKDGDDSSLIVGFSMKYKELVDISYDVFKLISDDFLQTLPLNSINQVIDTLVTFVIQKWNLNVSFASISQFWLIGDYMRTHYSKSETGGAAQGNELHQAILSQDLSISSWIYLLKRLMDCIDDERAEIKNGSIQTFYRILSSYISILPNWDLIFDDVLTKLLNKRLNENEMVANSEFLDSAFKGLIDIYPIHYNDFRDNDKRIDQWLSLISFFNHVLKSSSPEAAFIAITNFQKLIKKLNEMKDVPTLILKTTYETWCSFNIIYSDISNKNAYQNKSGYDCIDELIKGFPELFQLLKKYDMIEMDFVKQSLTLFNAAIRYPLLPEHTRDNKRPSTLQSYILTALNSFEMIKESEVERAIILQLSNIISLPFDTREKIEKKLMPKLSESSKNRIPTFEAVCYNASVSLKQRLSALIMTNKNVLDDVYAIKLMKNIGKVAERKSMINLSEDPKNALWIRASDCLRIIAVELFEDLTVLGKNEIYKQSVFDIYTSVTVAPLHRVNAEIDEETQFSDIEEFTQFSNLLLRPNVIKHVDEKQLNLFVSTVWTNSFLFELDEIEDELIKMSEDLFDLSKTLSNFKFSEIAGSTIEPPLLSKYNCSILCLKDLIKFFSYREAEYTLLREVAVQYLVSRTAFALRRYISDQSLIGKAPISKIRKIELDILLHGLREILERISKFDNDTDNDTVKKLQILYPLILRTIPISHKVPELQNTVLELSLSFTKLSSK